ncbi:MAG: hypothetical protein M1617_03915 [Actinobacteria bacterium]|nr:hypothetical protein [Actinomycetota bacterium]MCL5887437.1 hypothetical protein [Actinomycetota bacterium]
MKETTQAPTAAIPILNALRSSTEVMSTAITPQLAGGIGNASAAMIRLPPITAIAPVTTMTSASTANRAIQAGRAARSEVSRQAHDQDGDTEHQCRLQPEVLSVLQKAERNRE